MIQKIRNKAYNVLRWSEKYTKTDMLYLAKGGSWFTVGQVVSSSSVLLLAIAFANLLPPIRCILAIAAGLYGHGRSHHTSPHSLLVVIIKATASGAKTVQRAAVAQLDKVDQKSRSVADESN